MADLAVAMGTRPLWQNLPIFIVVMLGGFLTNLVWCLILMTENGTFGFIASRTVEIQPDSDDLDAHGAAAVSQVSAGEKAARSTAMLERSPRTVRVSLVLKVVLCAAAGLTWYFQFFFYGMGTTQMGKYDFSS